MTKEIFTADQLITIIVEGIEDVKGQQITILDLSCLLYTSPSPRD